MTDANTANAYLRTKVLSASPEELRLMLLDGAIRFATQAKEGLESKDFERSFEGFTRARDIITELIRAVRPEPDPVLAERVRALYAFMFKELIEASFEKDPARVEAVLELLAYERETWVLLMEKVAAERGAVRTPAGPSAPAPSGGTNAGMGSGLGSLSLSA